MKICIVLVYLESTTLKFDFIPLNYILEGNFACNVESLQ